MNIPNPKPKLEERLRGVLRLKQYSKRTEEGYVQWYRRYVRFQKEVCGQMRHPQEMGTEEVTSFLTNLAVNKNLAASSQNQALNALVFLYQEVLKIELEGIDAVRAKRPQHLPVVLTQEEVKILLAGVKGAAGLAVKLLYGTGLRQMECLRLRVKDVEQGRKVLMVRDGKGGKDRQVMLPKALHMEISDHVARLRALWEADQAASLPGVMLPEALGVKYPNAGKELAWQWLLTRTPPPACLALRASLRSVCLAATAAARLPPSKQAWIQKRASTGDTTCMKMR